MMHTIDSRATEFRSSSIGMRSAAAVADDVTVVGANQGDTARLTCHLFTAETVQSQSYGDEKPADVSQASI